MPSLINTFPLYWISIPKGSIKSKGSLQLSTCWKCISIPKGSIKRFQFTCSWIASSLFQFQKVRLKELTDYDLLSCYRISIPKGSIKSVFFWNWLFLHRNISIPKGSIKSLLGKKVEIWQTVISIPKGSIKRRMTRDETVTHLQISIPKGSIKSQCRQNQQQNHQNFNSKRFD